METARLTRKTLEGDGGGGWREKKAIRGEKTERMDEGIKGEMKREQRVRK